MTFVGTMHCALENGADLCVNEFQKIRHYRAKPTEQRRKSKITILYFARCVRKLRYSAIEHDDGV